MTRRVAADMPAESVGKGRLAHFGEAMIDPDPVIHSQRGACGLQISNYRENSTQILPFTSQVKYLHREELWRRATNLARQASNKPACKENVFIAYSLSPCMNRKAIRLVSHKAATTLHIRANESSHP